MFDFISQIRRDSCVGKLLLIVSIGIVIAYPFAVAWMAGEREIELKQAQKFFNCERIPGKVGMKYVLGVKKTALLCADGHIHWL